MIERCSAIIYYMFMRQFCTTERTSACRFGQRPALLFLGDLNSESAASQTMDSEHTSSVVDRRLLLKSCLLRQGRTLAQLHSCKAVFFALLVCCKTPHCGIADQLEKRYGQSATNCRAEVTIIGFLPLRDSVCVCVQVYNYQLKPCLPAQQMTGSVSAAHPDWARCAPFRWRLGSFRWQFEVSMRQINKMLTAGIKMGKNIEEPTVVSHCKNPVRAKLWIRLSTCLTAKPGSQVGATHRPDKQQKTCSPL